jgi:hypothetical protein
MKSRPTITEQMERNASRRDEHANVELAEAIVVRNDADAVAEVVATLGNKKLASDAVKTIYEIAARDPRMVADHAPILIELLESKQNRLVWGAMIALDAIASLRTELIYAHLDGLRAVVQRGSVITRDHFVGILVQLAATKPDVIPLLLDQFATCPPNQLPMYAEKAARLLATAEHAEFVAVLTRRLPEMSTEAKKTRIGKIIKKLAR